MNLNNVRNKVWNLVADFPRISVGVVDSVLISVGGSLVNTMRSSVQFKTQLSQRIENETQLCKP
jgi:hypothetical protein